MQTSLQQLEAFHRFAAERIRNGGREMSLADLVDLWELENPSSVEQHKILEALKLAKAEMEAGLGRPAAEFNAELREEFGISDR